MSPTELRQRLQELHQDVAQDQVHPVHVASLLSIALDGAREAEEQDLCAHDDVVDRKISGPRGELRETFCAVCRKSLKSEFI